MSASHARCRNFPGPRRTSARRQHLDLLDERAITSYTALYDGAVPTALYDGAVPTAPAPHGLTQCPDRLGELAPGTRCGSPASGVGTGRQYRARPTSSQASPPREVQHSHVEEYAPRVVPRPRRPVPGEVNAMMTGQPPAAHSARQHDHEHAWRRVDAGGARSGVGLSMRHLPPDMGGVWDGR